MDWLENLTLEQLAKLVSDLYNAQKAAEKELRRLRSRFKSEYHQSQEWFVETYLKAHWLDQPRFRPIGDLTSSLFSKYKRALQYRCDENKTRLIAQLLAEVLNKEYGYTPEDIERMVPERQPDTRRQAPGDSSLHHYKRMPRTDIEQAFGQAQEEIFILDTFIYGWHSYQQHIEAAAAGRPRLRIRILLSDPQSAIHELRTISLGPEDRRFTYTAENLRALQLFHNTLREQGHPGLEVRLHDQIPAMNCFGTSSEAFVGWYWMNKSTHLGPWLHVKQGHDIYQAIRKHFEEQWKAADALDLDSKALNDSACKLIKNHPQAKHFMCYYRRDGRVETMVLSLLQHQKRAALSLTHSGRNYVGTFKRIGREVTFTMHTTGEDHDRRPVFLVVEVGDFREIQQRALCLGTFAYIRELGESAACRIVLIATPTIPASRPQLAWDQIPDGIEGFLAQDELLIRNISEIDTPEMLIQKYGQGNNLLRRSEGTYNYYFLREGGKALFRSKITIHEHGNVSVFWHGLSKITGHAIQTDSRYIVMEVRNGRDDFFWVVIRPVPGGPRAHFQGIFMGMGKQKLYSGRLFMHPLEEGSNKNQEDTATLHWGTPEFDAVVQRWPALPTLLWQSSPDLILDDPGLSLRDPHHLTLPEGRPLQHVAGVYSYYYLRVPDKREHWYDPAATRLPEMRRLALEITPGGYFHLREFYDQGRKQKTIHGTAICYEHRLHLFFFEDEGQRKRLFRGMATCYINQDETSAMYGVSTLSPGEQPLARRILCIREHCAFDDLPNATIPIDSEACQEAERRHPGLVRYLSSEPDSILITPRHPNPQRFEPSYDLAATCFEAACYQAMRQDYVQAQARLRQALLLGFADQQRFAAATLPGGELHPCRDDIAGWLGSIQPQRVWLP